MATVQLAGRLLCRQMSTTVCPADSEEAVSTSTRRCSTCGSQARRPAQQPAASVPRPRPSAELGTAQRAYCGTHRSHAALP